jgi:hypothetical protein
MEYVVLYSIHQRGERRLVAKLWAHHYQLQHERCNEKEDLRSLVEWVVLDGIIEFPREALLHVEAALFLLGREMPRAYTHTYEGRACRA